MIEVDVSQESQPSLHASRLTDPMPRRLAALLLLWHLVAPSGLVWANIAPPYLAAAS